MHSCMQVFRTMLTMEKVLDRFKQPVVIVVIPVEYLFGLFDCL